MTSFAHIIGAIAVILFGVRFLREGLGRILGPRLQYTVQRLASCPSRAFLVGLGIGTLVPSSTSVSMLLRQAIRTGQLVARQVIPLMLGADIGITALVLLSSLHIAGAAPWLLAAGVVLYLFSRSHRSVGTGQMIIGLGFVFLAIGQLEIAGAEVGASPDMMSLIAIAARYPAALLTISAFFAVALQSSTATILLLAGLGAAGALPLPLAFYVVIGANLGIPITRMIVGWNLSEARRLALISLVDRAAVAAFALAISPLLMPHLLHLPLLYAVKVALLHLAFNLIAALLGAVSAGLLVNIANRAIQARGDEDVFAPRYLTDAAFDTPNLALGQSLREILRAAEIVREMLADLWRAMESGDEATARAVAQRDDQVDLLDKEIKNFLTRLASHCGDPEIVSEQMRQLHFLSDIEAIGDIVDKNLCELVLKKLHARSQFPDAAWRDLQNFFDKVQENMLIAEIAFQTRDVKLAAQLLRHKQWLNRYHRQLTDRQFARLTHGLADRHDVSSVHLDLLGNLKRINSCLSHVAYAVLPANPGAPQAVGASLSAGVLSGEMPALG